MGLASRLLTGQRKLSTWEQMGRERPKPSVAPHPEWCSPGPHTPSNSPCGLFSPCLPTETAFSRQTDSSNAPAGPASPVQASFLSEKLHRVRAQADETRAFACKPRSHLSSPGPVGALPCSFAFSFAITKCTCLLAPRRRVSRHTERPSLPTHLPAVQSWAS